jgi:hypothetical protein
VLVLSGECGTRVKIGLSVPTPEHQIGEKRDPDDTHDRGHRISANGTACSNRLMRDLAGDNRALVPPILGDLTGYFSRTVGNVAGHIYSLILPTVGNLPCCPRRG